MHPPFSFLMYFSAALLGLGLILGIFFIRSRLGPTLFCLGATLLFLVCISWFLVDQLTFMQRAPTIIVKGKITSITIDSTGSSDDPTATRVFNFTPTISRV